MLHNYSLYPHVELYDLIAFGSGNVRAGPGITIAYGIMTTFMLQGAKVRLSGRVGELIVVVVGGAQVFVPAGSGKVPDGEPDKS